MGAPAYQVTNLETCSPRQVALLVLGFFGLWATLYGLGASAPPLYVSQCSSSTRCADGVDGANLFSTGATPLYVSDPALCANKSACTRETCYLDRDGTLDWELQVAGLTSLNSFVLLEAFVTSRAAATATRAGPAKARHKNSLGPKNLASLHYGHTARAGKGGA